MCSNLFFFSLYPSTHPSIHPSVLPSFTQIAEIRRRSKRLETSCKNCQKSEQFKKSDSQLCFKSPKNPKKIQQASPLVLAALGAYNQSIPVPMTVDAVLAQRQKTLVGQMDLAAWNLQLDRASPTQKALLLSEVWSQPCSLRNCGADLVFPTLLPTDGALGVMGCLIPCLCMLLFASQGVREPSGTMPSVTWSAPGETELAFTRKRSAQASSSHSNQKTRGWVAGDLQTFLSLLSLASLLRLTWP